MKKLFRCVSDSLRGCSAMLHKEAFPHISLKGGKSVDLRLEKMDDESIYNIIEDILKGVTIKDVPTVTEDGVGISKGDFNFNKDLEPKIAKDIRYKLINFSKNLRNVRTYPFTPEFYYDDITHRFGEYKPAVLVPEYPMKIPAVPTGKIAKEGVDYKFACTKVDLPEEMAKEVIQWGKKNVQDDILFTSDESEGREDDIHVTLFYGIKSDDPDKLREIISKIKPFEIRLGLVNAFKNKDDCDVLKIEVESGDLEKLHYSIRDDIDNKNDFPTYEPHVTIAYVKKNSVNHLIGHEAFKGKTFISDNIVFSPSEGKDIILPLAK